MGKLVTVKTKLGLPGNVVMSSVGLKIRRRRTQVEGQKVHDSRITILQKILSHFRSIGAQYHRRSTFRWNRALSGDEAATISIFPGHFLTFLNLKKSKFLKSRGHLLSLASHRNVWKQEIERSAYKQPEVEPDENPINAFALSFPV